MTRVSSGSLYNFFRWTAMAGSLAGNYFVNQKDVLGMYIWLAASLLWVVLNTKKKNWPETIMFSVYSLYNIQGIYLWTK